MDEETASRIAKLTPRQRDCLRLVPHLITGKAIAIELKLSHETVKAHLNAAMRTLGVSDRHAAARQLTLAEGVAPTPATVGAGEPAMLTADEPRAAPPANPLVETEQAAAAPNPQWVNPEWGIENRAVSVAKPPLGELPQVQGSPDQAYRVREPPALFPAFDAPRPSGSPANSGEGRRLNNDLWRRLAVVLAWVLGAPLAMAVLVLLYVAATNLRFH